MNEQEHREFAARNARYTPKQWELRLNAFAAYDAWCEGDEASVSVETGRELITKVAEAFDSLSNSFDGHQHVMEIRAWRVANAARKLLEVYNNFKGDLDGEATQKVHDMVGTSGL